MEIFNLIASACSIIGLIVSLVVASKVHRLSDVIVGDDAIIQNGDNNSSIQNKTGDNSVIATNSSVNYTINNKKDSEPPVLSQSEYLIVPQEYDKYKKGISNKTCEMIELGHSNNIRFKTNFSDMVSRPEDNRWIGFAIKSLPMYDWRSLVKEDYILQFNYIATENISNIYVEITNKRFNKKLYKKKVKLSTRENNFQLPLGQYKKCIDDWKSVDEICFVFFPEECIGEKGDVFITDLILAK